METRSHGHITRQAGAVLLETVLVLPIFMFLLGGVMWLGQLTVAKEKLVVADRYIAWNVGNRLDGTPSASFQRAEVQRLFFPNNRYDVIGVGSPNYQSAPAWWWEAYGGVESGSEMPVWTRGWFETRPGLRDSVVPRRSYVVKGRDIPAGPSGRYEGHRVFMRSNLAVNSPLSTRDNLGQAISPDQQIRIDYNQVYAEPWPVAE